VAVIQRVNLVPDPAFTLNGIAGGVWAGSGSAVVTLSKTIQAWAGAGTVPAPWSMQIAWATGSAYAEGAAASATGFVIGQQYRLNAWVDVPSGYPDIALGVVGIGSGTPVTTKNTPAVASYVFTATATAHTVRITNATAATAGQSAFVGAVWCEAGSALYPFFSGEYPGAYWGPGGVSVMPAYDTTVNPQLPIPTVELDARVPRGYWPMAAQSTPDWGYGRGLGELTLDDPTSPLGTAVLSPSPRWLTVPTAIKSIAIRRGRTSTRSPIQPGTATITLDNRTGVFDTDAHKGPFVDSTGANALRKGMLVRVCANWTGSDGILHSEPRFVGRLDSTTGDQGWNPSSSFTAVDDLSLLSGAAIAPQATPARYGDTTPQRIQWAWTAALAAQQPAAVVSTSASMGRQLTATGGGGTALSIMQEAADAEGGRLHASRTGVVTALAHADLYGTASAGLLTDQPGAGIEFHSPAVSPGMDSVINQATVTRGLNPDGTTVDSVTASAAGSDGSHSISVSGPLLNYSEAQALAAYLASRAAVPATRIDAVTIDLAGQAWAPLMLADIAGQAQFDRTTAYGRRIAMSNTIEGIAEDVTASGGWVIGLSLSPLDTGALFGSAGPFLLDVSLLGGTAVLTSY
jgi:hypothetical protein